MYVKQRKLEWPLLLDRDRSLYKAYGMHRGGWTKVLGPAAMLTYFKLILKGRMPRMSHDDVWQLGGDVIIDPEGVVRLHHVSKTPADRPSVESLLEVVQS